MVDRDDAAREEVREEIREEIRFYLEMRTRELEASGMSPEQAAKAALEAFGNPDAIEREVTGMTARRRRIGKIAESLATTVQDLRYAWRFLRRNPGFTAVVLGTLALGIGANTAIFSLLDQALLRAPAVSDPGSLVAVYTTSRRGFPRSASSYPDYEDYRDRTRAIADLAGTSRLPVSLGDEERGARLITVETATGNLFPLLGLEAAHGRVLQPGDDRPGGGASVVVLSHGLWSDRFGADPAVLGQTVRMNDRPFEVVGVLPEAYAGLSLGDEPDAWVPMQSAFRIASAFAVSDPEVFQRRGSRWMGRLVGRLAPGATVEQAREELLALSDRLSEEDPAARGPRSVTVDPLARYLLPLGSEDALRGFVWLLVGVVGTTLLLASANLANLLLARASTRRSEIGVRLAVGAGRARLVRQLFTESVALALLGGALGLGVAHSILTALAAYELPGGVPIGALGVTLDGRVLAAALGISIVTALLFGLVPALQTTRPGVVEALRSGRGSEARGQARLRSGLLASQMALCLVLLVGSGLFVRTLQNALQADVGVRTDDLALARFSLGAAGYDADAAARFGDQIQERLAALPGTQAAALTTLVPFQGGGRMGVFVQVEGYVPAPDEEMRVDLVFTTPGFTDALGIELLDGRYFDPSDSQSSGDVVVVSASMAERYWPGGRAVGGTLDFGQSLARVIGVVDDVRWGSLDGETTDFVFLPLAQSPDIAADAFMTAAVRTTRDPDEALPAIRREIRALDADVSPSFVLTMDDLVGSLLMPQRLGAVLLSAFGLLSLILATVGIAGVVSYRVREQRRAIGIRIALGAERGQVHRLVVGGVAGPLLLGLGAGLAGAVALRGAVAGFLYEVAPGDPFTYVAVVLGLGAVALAASLLPAREAARTDPVQVLKAE